mmetsp:Transcript_89943/g.254779  ORF Transcript_89943/g.254779 Transcript_89943/m.254779 type:complete len:352 (-) Transcript_89943:12-1067(-)
MRRPRTSMVDDAAALREEPRMRRRPHEADLLRRELRQLPAVAHAAGQAARRGERRQQVELSPAAEDHAAPARVRERAQRQLEHLRGRQAVGQHRAPAHGHGRGALVEEGPEGVQGAPRRQVRDLRRLLESPRAGLHRPRGDPRPPVEDLANREERWARRLEAHQDVECRLLQPDATQKDRDHWHLSGLFIPDAGPGHQGARHYRVRREGVQCIRNGDILGLMVFHPLLSSSCRLSYSLHKITPQPSTLLHNMMRVCKNRHGVDAMLDAPVHQVGVREHTNTDAPLLNEGLGQGNQRSHVALAAVDEDGHAPPAGSTGLLGGAGGRPPRGGAAAPRAPARQAPPQGRGPRAR